MSNRTPKKFVNSIKFVVSPSKAIYNILSLLIRLADKLLFICKIIILVCSTNLGGYGVSP